MKKFILFCASTLVLTSACSAQTPSIIPQLQPQIMSSYSKTANTAKIAVSPTVKSNIVKETLTLKDLPKNFLYVPLSRQATDYTCGVGVTQSILMYYGDEYREDELAQALKSDPNEGTPYKNIADFSKSNGYTVNIFKNMTLEDLKAQIDKKIPVIVLLQAWPDGPVDYANDWNDGHYSIAIGYDDKKIYFMDPSTLGYYTYVPTTQFMDRWHDTDGAEKLTHFGMTMTKGAPKYNHNQVFMME